MNQKLLSKLSSLLLLVFLSLPSFGQENPFDIGMTGTAITVDGTIESAWDEAPGYLIADPTSWSPNADIQSMSDLSASFRALWDANNLYLLFEVTDEVATTGPVGGDNYSWMNDNVEITIEDPAGVKKAYFYRFSYARDNESLDGRSPAGFSFVTSDVTGGYVIEASIPWTSLVTDSIDFSSYPAVDKTMKMSIGVADLDDPTAGGWDQLSGHVQWKAWSAREVILKNTAAIDNTAPAKPTGLSVSDISFNGAVLEWDEVADSDVEGYMIFSGNKPKGLVNSESYSPSLSPEKEYTYSVAAIDRQNFSATSDPVVFTTAGKPALKSATIAKYTGTKTNPFEDFDIWDAQPELEFGWNPTGTIANEQDLGGWYKAMWDEDNLYLVTYVVDQEIFNGNAEAKPWETDNVEVHFDMKAQRDGTSCEDVDGDKYQLDNFQYRFIANRGDLQTGSTPAPEWAGVTQATWELYDNTGENVIGFYIESSWPWSTLNATSGESFVAQENAEFAWDIKISDTDPGTDGGAASVTWSTYEHNNLNRDNAQFGMIILGLESGLKDFRVNQLSIFPNPSSGQLNIVVPDMGESLLSIRDISGKVVKSGMFTSSGIKTMNIESLSAGIYFVMLENNGDVKVSRLVVK